MQEVPEAGQAAQEPEQVLREQEAQPGEPATARHRPYWRCSEADASACTDGVAEAHGQAARRRTGTAVCKRVQARTYRRARELKIPVYPEI